MCSPFPYFLFFAPVPGLAYFSYDARFLVSVSLANATSGSTDTPQPSPLSHRRSANGGITLHYISVCNIISAFLILLLRQYSKLQALLNRVTIRANLSVPTRHPLFTYSVNSHTETASRKTLNICIGYKPPS